MSQQIEIVKKYIQLVQTMNFTEESTAGLLHKDYLQWELPNQLNKIGQKSDAADSFKRMKTAQMILQSQNYEITKSFEQHNTVIIEANWSATMAMDAGPIKKGQQMKAFFCMIFDFKDGQIHRVRNYDCFEPF